VDVGGSRNRVLSAEAVVGSRSVQMGDVLTAPAGAAVRVTVHVVGTSSARVLVLEQGQPDPVGDALLASDDETKTFDVRSDGKQHWLRVEVRGADGKPLLIGNPFYVNWAPRPAAK
jgi:hypothetical protein